MFSNVILVDNSDREIGVMGKMEAHQKGVLHRAFSLFIFNKKGEMLLQKRASCKYHSPNLWTNTCCSHPQPNENILDNAKKRLIQEMGFTTFLKPIFTFTYKTQLENNLIEHELDHVFIGEYEGEILPNVNEVAEYKYISLSFLEKDIKNNTHEYTSWFCIALPLLITYLKANA